MKSGICYIIIILGLICSCSRNDCMYHEYYGNGVLFEEGKLLNGKKEGLRGPLPELLNRYISILNFS